MAHRPNVAMPDGGPCPPYGVAMSQTDRLRWGILSTGNIAKTFATALPKSETGTLHAVASRTKEKAEKFAAEFEAAKSYGSYDELLADPEVDAVYLATPHPQHAQWGIKACRAGKHLLCEKPIGVNYTEAEAIFEAGHEHGVFVMEAYMYRCHPLMQKLVELIKDKTIGDVQVIESTFAFRGGGESPDYANARLFADKHAGGGILDVGGYASSAALLVAAAANDVEVIEPQSIKAVGITAENGIDEVATATLKFSGNIVANLLTGVRVNAGQRLTIFGTKGRIDVSAPFLHSKEGGREVIQVNGEDVAVETAKHLYALEADAFAQGVRTGTAPHPAMSRDESLANARVTDAWRKQAGVQYSFETDTGYPKTTLTGDRVKVKDDAPIGRTDMAGVSVSRFVMGCDNQTEMSQAAPLFDAFYERGGNAFDTANIYGGGRQTTLLGHWMTSRGVRDGCVVVCKGVHTPQNFPKFFEPQLQKDLERLQTDHCEFYFCHRDNRDVPIGEWVDVLNEGMSSGLITKGFGGSNWDLDRVQAFNEYATKHGKTPMVAVSMNLSLAEMVDPVWGGVQSAHTPEWLAWLKETQTPNFAWSSQARGFFVPGRDLDEAELNRCWVNDANLQRRERAFELAKQKNVEPVSIAAAWVLKQPFPSVALIGPRSLTELRTSLPGLAIGLSDQEHKWLNLEADSPS